MAFALPFMVKSPEINSSSVTEPSSQCSEIPLKQNAMESDNPKLNHLTNADADTYIYDVNVKTKAQVLVRVDEPENLAGVTHT